MTFGESHGVDPVFTSGNSSRSLGAFFGAGGGGAPAGGHAVARPGFGMGVGAWGLGDRSYLELFESLVSAGSRDVGSTPTIEVSFPGLTDSSDLGGD